MYEVDYTKTPYLGKCKETVRQSLLHSPSVRTQNDLRSTGKMRLPLWRKQPIRHKH